jgi:asparagine synthase (glutamine-hydrolysing)
LHSEDPVRDYARVFMDREHAMLQEQLDPRWHCAADESRAFVAAHFGAPGAETPVDKALRLDSTVMLVDDPSSGRQHDDGVGLEARVPFLDHELVELAARIPPALKTEGPGAKAVLKMSRGWSVPHQVIDRRRATSRCLS